MIIIPYVYVTSDGSGFQITTDDQNNREITVSTLLSFGIDYHLAIKSLNKRNGDIVKQLESIIKVLDQSMVSIFLLGIKVKFNTYYYDASQLVDVDSRFLYEALKVIFPIIIDYPEEFTNHISNVLYHYQFDATSTYGACVYKHYKRYHGVAKYIHSGNEKFALTDSNGNVIELTPKVLKVDPSEVINNIDSVDFTYMDNIIKSIGVDLRARIKSLKSNLSEVGTREYNRGYNAGVSVLTSLPDGWSVESIPGKLSKYMVYHGDVHAKYINRRSILYKIPDEISQHIKFTDIAVPISDKLNGVLGKGWHPHISNNTDFGKLDDRWDSVCIGDLGGKPFSRLNEIIEQMSIIYTHSMYSGSGSEVINLLMNNQQYVINENDVIPIDMYGNQVPGSAHTLRRNDPMKLIYKHAGRLSTDDVVEVWSN